jgi:hypothetical protein
MAYTGQSFTNTLQALFHNIINSKLSGDGKIIQKLILSMKTKEST